MSNQVAAIILQQLGGNRFIAMTGAKNLCAGERSVSAKIGKNAGKVTHIAVTLNAADTYDMRFINIRGINMKDVANVEGVYADQLQRVFTDVTGMDTHL